MQVYRLVHEFTFIYRPQRDYWKVEFQARVRETSSSSRSERVQEGFDFRLNYVMKEEPP